MGELIFNSSEALSPNQKLKKVELRQLFLKKIIRSARERKFSTYKKMNRSDEREGTD